MNIVYMHTHDSGTFLKPYGHNVPTDNLLDFAKDATVFRQAFCAAPTCSPSRAALLTGMYPHRNGMLGLAHRGFKINDYSKHMAQYLKNFNYETALSGVQHEAAIWTEYEKAAKIIGYDVNLTKEPETKEEGKMVDWDLKNAKSAADYIIKKSKTGEKFFLSFGMFSTHRKYPEKIDDEIDERYVALPPMTKDTEENRRDTARYLTSAKKADECIKIVLDALKVGGIYDNTVIIFTTDHGIANPFNKCTLFDSGIGVALILRDPRQKEQGKVIDSMISQVDIFPTLCDVVGIPKPEWLQGISFSSLIEGKEESVREEIYGEINFHTSYEPARCIRTKRYKYIKYFDNDYLKYNYSNIDDSQPKKLLLDHGLMDMKKDREALYDLYFDPYEKRNLVNEGFYQNTLMELKEKLNRWQVATKDDILNGKLPIPKGSKVNKKYCISPGSKNKEDYDSYPD